LKEDIAFRELKQSSQNFEISEMAARLFPEKFPGNVRIGDSTLRRYRWNNPDWFK
jgi:hypothetical protein